MYNLGTAPLIRERFSQHQDKLWDLVNRRAALFAPRFLVGPTAPSMLTRTLGAQLWPELLDDLTALGEEALLKIAGTEFNMFNHIREHVSCLTGMGQNNKTWTNSNWYDRYGIRIHFVIEGSGQIECVDNNNAIFYKAGDVLLFDKRTVGKQMRHQYTPKPICYHQVLILGNEANKDIKNWNFKKSNNIELT